MFLPIVDNDDVAAVKNIDEAARDNLKERINATDPHFIFTPAGESRDHNKRRIICPACQNGTGEDATPIEAIWSGDRWLYNCFRCDSFSGDLMKIICTEEHLDQNNFNDWCTALAIGANFTGQHVSETNYSTKSPMQKKSSHVKEKQPSKEYLKLVHDDIAAAQKNIGSLPKDQRRGLEPRTLKYFGFGYLEKWTHPKLRLEGTPYTSSRRIIIPTENHYNAVALPEDRQLMKNAPEEKKKYWKMHTAPLELFNSRALTSDADLILVLEGEFDAASIWQAFEEKISVVAVLGVSNWKATLLPKLDGITNKKFLIIFDAEPDSRKQADNLRGELVKRGIPAVCRFFYDALLKEAEEGTKDLPTFDNKIDANQILLERGNIFLRDLTEKIISASRADFEATELEIVARKNETTAPTTPPELYLNDEQCAALFGDNSTSDYANAKRLVYLFGDRLHYLNDTDNWLIFANGIWTKNNSKKIVMPFVTRAATLLKANAKNDNEHKIAACFESSKKAAPAINFITGISEVIITEQDLNRHNNLLNCKNGVIDLQTGKFYETVDPKLLITQQCNAIYRADYHNETPEKFFGSILPDEPTREAMIRFIGYAATGECTEERALFFNGDGGNGKGTLTKTLLHLFGSYATTLKTSAILLTGRTQDAGAATTELNPLQDCRLAIVEELPQGGKLDVAKFKNLTGGDKIPIRKLHQEQINIEPHFSPILSGNYLPELSDTRDPGLLRRLMNIKFTQSFTGQERDPHLKEKLITDESLSGLLTLVVNAAQDWYRDGLLESAAMKQATSDYLSENDFISEFIEEYCERRADLSIARNEFLGRLKNSEYAAECLKLFGNRDRALTDAIKRINGISYRRGGKESIYKFFGVGWKQKGAYDDWQGTPVAPDYIP